MSRGLGDVYKRQLQPDIEIYNTPESQLKGEDHQLEEAVKVMLQTVKK